MHISPERLDVPACDHVRIVLTVERNSGFLRDSDAHVEELIIVFRPLNSYTFRSSYFSEGDVRIAEQGLNA